MARRTGRASAQGAGLAALMLLAGIPTGAWAQTPSEADERSVLERALDSRSRGVEAATVVIFEIADFQCPYCAQFSRTVAPELHRLYVQTGKVQWVYVNLPLHNHPLAWLAAEAALCAGAAGDRFWAMHDRLYEEQQSWSRSGEPHRKFAEYARAAGVPMAEYQACVDQDLVAPLILQDLGSAISARIDGTPTFIIMKGQEVVDRLVGVQSVEEWARVLDAALAPQP